MGRAIMYRPSLGGESWPAVLNLTRMGGGVKRGTVIGETEDFSYNVIKDPVHVHDLSATVLHLLGLDHTRLTVRHQGRDYRLTDVHGKIVQSAMA
jgi:hypothetical protein